MNNRISRFHGRALRLVYSDYSSNFDKLRNESFSIHDRNIQMFAIEIYRFFDGLSPSIMKNIFQNDTYSLR